MNFIELLFHLKLEKYTFSKLSTKEVIKIEKIILAEKSIADHINNYDVEKLLLAIKKFPLQLDELLLRKEFLKMFIGKEKILAFRVDYLIETEQNIAFFNEVLKEDFELAFKKRIFEKDFQSLNNIMAYYKMFSQDFLQSIEDYFFEKIKNADYFFHDSNFRNTKEYDFLLQETFFELVSYFKSLDIESVVSSLYSKIVEAFNVHRYNPAKFVLDCLVSFSSYKTENHSFNEILQSNKIIALERINKRQYSYNNKPNNKPVNSSTRKYPSETKGYGNPLKFGGLIVLVFQLCLFIINLISDDLNSDSKNEHPFKIDQEEKVRVVIDDDVIFNYLANFEKSAIFSYDIDSVKYFEFGGNPFDFDILNYQNYNGHKNILLSNNTDFEIVVLNYIFAGDKTLFAGANYIPENEEFYIKSSWKNKFTLPTHYVLYFGNNLANFTTKVKQGYKYNVNRNIYKKDNKTPETRFLNVLPISKEILNHQFRFYNDIKIKMENGILKIDSDSMHYFIDKDYKNQFEQNIKFSINDFNK